MAMGDDKSKAIRVVQYGLGPIGMECAKLVLRKAGLQLVGAIDVDPNKVGKDVGSVIGLGKNIDLEVTSDAEGLLRRTEPQIVLHTTQSRVDKVYPQLLTCIEARANVVSSTEELFYPTYRHFELARKLDQAAKKHGVTVLGTGVNPGFVMDALVLFMTGVCTEVEKIKAERVVDASRRRLPLQKKIGAGIPPEEFRKLVAEGQLGHIGLVESLAMVAERLEWRLEDILETVDPVIAEREIETPYLKVQAGQVAGLKHIARGFIGGGEVITLDLRIYVGAEDPHDAIYIQGTPPIELRIPKGVFGDTATVASLINAIPRVLKSAPGLVTVADLPIPSAWKV